MAGCRTGVHARCAPEIVTVMALRALPPLGWASAVVTIVQQRLLAISATTIDVATLTSFCVHVTLVHDE